MEEVIGKKRIPMIIMDSPNVFKDRRMFSARGAGILGFSILSSRRCFAFDKDMNLDIKAIEEFLAKYKEGPILIFGFTYMIWEYFYKTLKKDHKKIDLSRGILIHGGGWKKMQREAVSPQKYKEEIQKVSSINKIYDYYGMAEQTGCIYLECECGHLHASIFSDILIRDMKDFSVCEIGKEGCIEVLSPAATAYPGQAILTEDQGILLGIDDCPCGRKGKYFKVTGRMKHAEVRGAVILMEREKIENKITRLAGGWQFHEIKARKPFDQNVMEFLEELSKEICTDAKTTSSVEARAFAFWCRKNHLNQWKKERETDEYSLGLGMIFHIAPSNIPLLFAYSMVFGLLSGNGNVIRISQRTLEESKDFCKVIDHVMRKENTRIFMKII